MKKRMKILLLAVIGVMFIVLSLPTIANAGMVLDANTNFAGTGDIQGAASKIAGVVAVIASGVAITMLIWLAAKYMTAAPSEKADIKKSATTYVIGAVILFAASGILGLISTFAGGLFSESGGGDGVDAVSGADAGVKK